MFDTDREPKGTALNPLIDYNSPVALRTFLEKHGLGAQKKFGQNFLINPEARKKLVAALEIHPNGSLWEVGPGLGAMTVGLLDSGARVTVFEIDRGFSNHLRELFGSQENFKIVEGDVLKTWPQEYGIQRPDYFFGNLPYNIAAVLLGDLIEGNALFQRMVVTVQKEVAQRMIAPPGTEHYSSFSVLCSSVYRITPLMTLKGASFFPPPNVDSQAVKMELRRDLADQSFPPLFYPLVRGLFSSRRKTVRNNLIPFLSSRGLDRAADRALTALSAAGIEPNQRAETLDLDEFLNLARTLEETYDHS
jgi:16S rRNA (adenine1518-N6/adenine1519-N6)-dimethyltransferase